MHRIWYQNKRGHTQRTVGKMWLIGCKIPENSILFKFIYFHWQRLYLWADNKSDSQHKRGSLKRFLDVELLLSYCCSCKNKLHRFDCELFEHVTQSSVVDHTVDLILPALLPTFCSVLLVHLRQSWYWHWRIPESWGLNGELFPKSSIFPTWILYKHI